MKKKMLFIIPLSVIMFLGGILFSGFVLNEKEDSLSGLKQLAQVGIIVGNIETASVQYARLFGVETPGIIVAENPSDNPTRYRGELTGGGCRLAFINLGNLQIELIEPMGKPSTWNDFLEKTGGGIHHLGFWVEDMDKSLESLKEQKISEIQKGGWDGGRYSYLEGTGQMNIIIELLENYDK